LGIQGAGRKSVWQDGGISRILVTSPKGIPPFLAAEVRALGFNRADELSAAVETAGTLDDTMRLNLHLRTAHRVLYLLREFGARTPDDLYAELSRIAWEDLIPDDGYLCVTSSVLTDSIRDTRFANVKCKDAIVDRIRARRGRRPDSGSDTNRSVVFLFWRGDRASVFLDTSGEPLSRRGYRKMPFKAPMQETLAAAVVLATGWDGRSAFINPMCGSGTLAIEAALIALRKPPGLLRGNFGFMHLKTFNPVAWEGVRKNGKSAALDRLPAPIVATDISGDAIAAARHNAETAGVAHLISFDVCDFRATSAPGGPGVVIFNPEYGERLGDAEHLRTEYKAIGDFLKQKCAGYNGYIFTGNLELAKSVGLRTKRRIPFFNSQIECRLLEYELYAGRR
jgi:23S rRNA G2445 N2-methylase RlmL